MTVENDRMARLRIREIAESKGINKSQLSRESKQTYGLILRYWNNQGFEKGVLDEVRLSSLQAIANALGVKVGELFEDTEEVV